MEELRIESLSIEFLSRIGAGNVFIKFNYALGKYQTKVILQPDQIVIQIDDKDYIIETSSYFSINIKSFYNLLVKDAFMSFRFIIANREKFNSEILINNATQNCVKYQGLKLSLKENESATLSCSNCKSKLNSETNASFKRILELPSSNMSISDWFCHRHSNEKVFQQGSESESCTGDKKECFNEETQLFEPKLHDIFYGPFHLLINSQVINTNSIRKKNSYIHCKRCLQLLGVCHYHRSTSSCWKFWWENVKFNDKLLYSDILSPIVLVKKAITNYLSCDSLTYLSPIIKIIFESSVPSTGQKLHILLQVMDKNLKLLQLNLDTFKLVQRSFVKVMFLKLNKINSDDDERTLKYWQKDINVMTYEFSFKMYQVFLDYLEKQSEVIPEIYRFNNSFQLSYIEIL
jgi:HECT-like Ubiquitin-conjugating enzyme (E2)-binding